MAFEDPRKTVFHFCGRGSDRNRAGDVSRAVEILGARVDEIEFA